jgi:hypothetical protein
VILGPKARARAEAPRGRLERALEALSPGEQKAARTVAGKLDARGTKAFLGCIERTIDGHSALLDRDKDGRTLLDALLLVAEAPPDPELESRGLTRADVLASTLEGCGQPGAITQGVGLHNTCVVADMQWLLAVRNPGEYARLVAGLATEGRAVLKNGEWLVRVEDSVAPDRYRSDARGKPLPDPDGPTRDPRNAADRLFQAAMMDFANGSDRYSDKDDQSVGPMGTYTGLYPEQQQRAVDALFGRPVALLRGDDGLTRVLDQRSAPVIANLHWAGGSHAVVVEQVEGGRVYFRNPFGPSRDVAGTVLRDPERRVENGEGRESMSLEAFSRAFQRTYIPL